MGESSGAENGLHSIDGSGARSHERADKLAEMRTQAASLKKSKCIREKSRDINAIAREIFVSGTRHNDARSAFSVSGPL